MISNRAIQLHLKTIRHHILKRKFSNLLTEELWTQELIMKEETQEWFKIKPRDLNRINLDNLSKTI
jgi:hypothetical protein